MLWWKGKLYVGTNRAFHCAERAALSAAFPLFAKFPFVKYPPNDPDTECTPDPADLPLRAEIWRWTPETETWQRVYQSPQDVPIPHHPGKYVAREVGFRDMIGFVEPDGTEALYVSSVNSQFIYPRMPPPRLLRSTDGLNFEPVPHEPGTYLGDIAESAFRTLAAYKDRLFVVGAGTIYGDGVLLESRNPKAGDDHFQPVSPPGMRVFEMVPFNGYLYLGLRDTKRGYAVVKTDASGSPPYTFTPVVTEGACLSLPSQSVISMHVFNGRLYVGTDGPAELIRINPDDTWDLLIGAPRETPDGWKHPLSGLDAGFHNWLNGHIWRMQTHEGRLYLGTMNTSTHLRSIPGADPVLRPNYGFDLFETADGWHFTPITVTGLGDQFAFGVRSLASTPHGLFLGTANSWYGLRIWRGTREGEKVEDERDEHIEVETRPTVSPEVRPQTVRPMGRGPQSFCEPPEQLEVECFDDHVMLWWAHSAPIKEFRVWRASVSDQRRSMEANPYLARLLPIIRAALALRRDIYVARLPAKLWIPGAYEEIGATEKPYFVDVTVSLTKKRYLYYVQAVSDAGDVSKPSHIMAAPPLRPAITFEIVLKTLDQQVDRARSASAETVRAIRDELRQAHGDIQAGNPANAGARLQALSQALAANTYESLEPWRLADLRIMLAKLRQRVALSHAGIIPTAAL